MLTDCASSWYEILILSCRVCFSFCFHLSSLDRNFKVSRRDEFDLIWFDWSVFERRCRRDWARIGFWKSSIERGWPSCLLDESKLDESSHNSAVATATTTLFYYIETRRACSTRETEIELNCALCSLKCRSSGTNLKQALGRGWACQSLPERASGQQVESTLLPGRLLVRWEPSKEGEGRANRRSWLKASSRARVTGCSICTWAESWPELLWLEHK